MLLKDLSNDPWHNITALTVHMTLLKSVVFLSIQKITMRELYWRGHSWGRYCLHFIFNCVHINRWVLCASNSSWYSMRATHHWGACFQVHHYFTSCPILRLSPRGTPCTAHAIFDADTHLNSKTNLKFMGIWFSTIRLAQCSKILNFTTRLDWDTNLGTHPNLTTESSTNNKE